MQQAHRQRDRVAGDGGKAASVPTSEHELQRCLDVRAEVEPPRKTLRDLAHRRESLTCPRPGVGDRFLDDRRANLRRPADADVGAIELEHLGRTGRVDQEERCAVRDVVAEQLRRLVTVRRAPRGVEQRDVVRIDQILSRGSRQLTEPDHENSRAQRVLEGLAGAEVGRERDRTNHLGGADGLLGRGRAQTVDRDDGGRGVNGRSSSAPVWTIP